MIDFAQGLFSRNGVLPIEVKAGKKGSMKSLSILMSEKKIPLGIRTSQENFAKLGAIRIIPLYMIGELDRYL